jgi:hypothetical protein
VQLAIDPEARIMKEGVLTIKTNVSKIDKSTLNNLKDKTEYMCFVSTQSLMVCKINKPTEPLPYRLEYIALSQDWVQIEVKHVESPKPSFGLQLRNGSVIKFKSATLDESLRWIADFEKILKRVRSGEAV